MTGGWFLGREGHHRSPGQEAQGEALSGQCPELATAFRAVTVAGPGGRGKAERFERAPESVRDSPPLAASALPRPPPVQSLGAPSGLAACNPARSPNDELERRQPHLGPYPTGRRQKDPSGWMAGTALSSVRPVPSQVTRTAHLTKPEVQG